MQDEYGIERNGHGWLQLFGGEDDAAAAAAAAAAAGGDKGKTEPFAVFADEKSFMARVNREGKAAAQAQLDATAKELGYETHAAMLEAAKAHKGAEDAKKGEAEREKEARLKAEAKSAEREAKSAQALLKADVIRHATELNFADAEDALALMDRSAVKVDLDATTVEGVKESLEALAKKKPHLLKAQDGKLPDKGGADLGDKGKQPAEKGTLREAIAKALNGGK